VLFQARDFAKRLCWGKMRMDQARKVQTRKTNMKKTLIGLSIVIVLLTVASVMLPAVVSVADAGWFGLINFAPSITTVSPSGVKFGSPAFTLTVNGTNFVSDSVVRWKGTDRTTTFVSSDRLTAAIPAADVAITGTASITVFNPAPGGGTSNPMTVTINSKTNTTTTIVSDFPDPSQIGQPVTVTYTVTASAGTPTGTVTVTDGSATCSASVATGTCTLTLTVAGKRTLTATYGSDATFNDSSGSASHFVVGPMYMPFVNKAPTSTPTATPTATPTRTPVPITNPIRNGGFEQGAADWLAGTQIPYYAPPVGDILAKHRSQLPASVTPHSGDWAAWLGGFSNSTTTLQTADPPFIVPSGGSTLRYWLWIQSDETTCDLTAVDGAWVFFATDNQQYTVDSFNLCTTNATNGWVKHDLNLSQFVGKSGWLSFVVRNIGQNSNLFIDDVAMGTLSGAQFIPSRR
jgi:hypothetical protein